MFFSLLKPGILAFRHSLSARVIVRRLPFIALGILFWILLYLGTVSILSYVRGIDIFGEILSRRLFSLTFFSLAGFLVLSNIITALSSFYLSKDLPLLLSRPIGTPDVLRLKSCETILDSSWMVMSFLPPVLVAFGVSYHAPLEFFILVLIAFIMFTLITAGAGITLAHLLMRFFPAYSTRVVLLGIGIVILLAVYFLIKSIVPADPDTPGNFISALMAFKTDSPFLPGYWVTEAVWPVLEGKGPESFYMTVLFANGAFFMTISELAGLRLYRDNIDRIQPSGRAFGKNLFRNLYPGRAASVMYKDIKIFFRDTGQWSQIFIIGALILIYVYNFRSIPLDALTVVSPYIKEIMVLVNLLLAGLVLSAVAARFLYSSVSLEGRAFWIIRTAPVDIKDFLWSKFLHGCIPVAFIIVSLVFLTNLALDITGIVMLVSLGTVLMLCVSISALGTGFGAVYPIFRYENIASVSMSLGGIAFMLVAFSVVVATLLSESWIFYIYHTSVLKGGMQFHEIIQTVLCVALILLINFSAFYLPMKIGGKKLIKQPCSF